jgi:hypothetical protein
MATAKIIQIKISVVTFSPKEKCAVIICLTADFGRGPGEEELYALRLMSC